MTGLRGGRPYPPHEDGGGELDHPLAPVGEGRRLGAQPLGADLAHRLWESTGEHRRAPQRLSAQGTCGLRLDGHLLAEEQLAGRLRIYPGFVFGSSEVFTEQARRRVEEAWSEKPFEVYAVTESAGIVSECDLHSG